MPLKPVLSVDIDDKAFQNFKRSFDQYRVALSAMPASWKQVNQQIQGMWASHRGLVSSMVAAGVQQRLSNQAQSEADRILERLDRHTKGLSGTWRGMAGSAKSFAHFVGDATKSLLRWTSIGGVVTGLLGLGGLWGLERLGSSVASGRRSALGLGLSYGEQKAFDLNFGQLVDSPEGVLGGVFEATHDVTKRHTLYAAGLGEQDLQGKDTAQVSAALLDRIQQLAKATPENQLGNVFKSRFLGQFITLQDFERARAISRAEQQTYQHGFVADARTLGLTPETQASWKNLTIQVDRAGRQIETTFIEGITPLAGPLKDLSKEAVNVVKTFFDVAKSRHWVERFGEELKKFATFLGSPEFESDIKSFVNIIANAVDWVKEHAPALATVAHVASAAKDVTKGLVGAGRVGAYVLGKGAELEYNAVNKYLIPHFGGGRTGASNNFLRHNPGGLRPPGASTGFATFSSDAEGVRAIAHQLSLYNSRDKLDTITGILSKYAPSSENDLKGYISDVVRQTGFSANQHLNLRDTSTMSSLVAAITKHEAIHPYSAGAVKVVIQNAPGNNAVVSTSQVAVAP
jgi:hypothetical protein